LKLSTKSLTIATIIITLFMIFTPVQQTKKMNVLQWLCMIVWFYVGMSSDLEPWLDHEQVNVGDIFMLKSDYLMTCENEESTMKEGAKFFYISFNPRYPPQRKFLIPINSKYGWCEINNNADIILPNRILNALKNYPLENRKREYPPTKSSCHPVDL